MKYESLLRLSRKTDHENMIAFDKAIRKYGEYITPKKARKLLNLLNDDYPVPGVMYAVIHVIDKLMGLTYIETLLNWIASKEYKHTDYLNTLFFGILNSDEYYLLLKNNICSFLSENLQDALQKFRKECDEEDHILKCDELLSLIDTNSALNKILKDN